jgi:hypothetical protein
MAEWLPAGNLEERQHQGPTIRTFLELAQKEPDASFEGYIITGARDDERLSIDGVHVPSSFDFAGTGIDPATADEDDQVGDFKRRLWWD